jgi:plastocyanin
LRIKNHKFNIEKIEVPAGKKFKIKVINEDSTSEEFESNSMIVEKFLGPKRSLTVTLGPLKPGTYEYFGEFHMKTAKGIVIAK